MPKKCQYHLAQCGLPAEYRYVVVPCAAAADDPKAEIPAEEEYFFCGGHADVISLDATHDIWSLQDVQSITRITTR